MSEIPEDTDRPRGMLVVQMTVDPERPAQVERHFVEEVQPWAQSQPGFVSGQWIRQAGGGKGMGLVTFGTEDQAEAAARGPRLAPHVTGRAWNTESVHVFAVVTQA